MAPIISIASTSAFFLYDGNDFFRKNKKKNFGEKLESNRAESWRKGKGGNSGIHFGIEEKLRRRGKFLTRQ